MDKMTNRYTEEELINLLYIWVVDYGRLPTHREIAADDRMPTYHTYIKRFGTLKNALQIAGIADIQNTSVLHEMVGSIVESTQEFVRIEDITVDFIVEHDHQNIPLDIVIDIVNLEKFDVSPETKDQIIDYRKSCVEDFGYEYLHIGGLLDFQKLEELRRK